ncbi:hypothetical protein [Nocardia colli]|uniref:hypothetical protein n=1 Tax=Nocardia colli TaxID=2545717 RepID=UPI00168D72E4|nr:hypothetical protein [Nocardia colli]
MRIEIIGALAALASPVEAFPVVSGAAASSVMVQDCKGKMWICPSFGDTPFCRAELTRPVNALVRFVRIAIVERLGGRDRDAACLISKGVCCDTRCRK